MTELSFYYSSFSPPSRAIWMVLEELGVPYEDRELNLFEVEHKTEEYKKINKMQKVPAIKDGNFCLAESRAIAAYLATTYGKKFGKENLYPEDIRAKAVVNKHMWIDSNLWDSIISYVSIGGVFFRGEQTHTEHIGKVKNALETMEGFLNEHTFIASDQFTIADIFSYVTVGMLMVTDFDDFGSYPKLEAWRKKISERPYHDKTFVQPMAKLRAKYREALEKNAKKDQCS